MTRDEILNRLNAAFGPFVADSIEQESFYAVDGSYIRALTWGEVADVLADKETDDPDQ